MAVGGYADGKDKDALSEAAHRLAAISTAAASAVSITHP
jgi:hypothetical protein